MESQSPKIIGCQEVSLLLPPLLDPQKTPCPSIGCVLPGCCHIATFMTIIGGQWHEEQHFTDGKYVVVLWNPAAIKHNVRSGLEKLFNEQTGF